MPIVWKAGKLVVQQEISFVVYISNKKGSFIKEKKYFYIFIILETVYYNFQIKVFYFLHLLKSLR